MRGPVMLSIFISSAEFQETSNKFRSTEIIKIFKIKQHFIATAHHFEI